MQRQDYIQQHINLVKQKLTNHKPNTKQYQQLNEILDFWQGLAQNPRRDEFKAHHNQNIPL